MIRFHWLPIFCFTIAAVLVAVSPPSPLAASVLEEKHDNGHTKDSLKTVQKNIAGKKAVMIDVREQREWDRGHLKAATLLPLSKLRKASDKPKTIKALVKGLPKKKIIYCHCRSGGRVLIAAPILRKLGFQVRPLAAGYRDLLKAGFVKAEQ